MKKIDVEYVAKLARLKLTGDEKQTLSGQLVKILEYMNKLNELDTRNVEPTAHALEIKNVFRTDETRQSNSPQDILSNAPVREGPYFKVRKVIE